jgi:hypothetical protein
VLLTITTGGENFDGIGVSKFYAFFVPSQNFQGTEGYLSARAKLPRSGVASVASPGHFMAAPGYREEYGRWTGNTYQMEEGVIFKLFAQIKRSSVSRPMSVNQLCRVRERAALRRVTFRTLGWEKGAFSEVSAEGRFDLINLDEARRSGVVIQPVFERTFLEMQPNGLLRETIISAEIEPAPAVQDAVVVNTAGKEITVPVVHRRRYIDI